MTDGSARWHGLQTITKFRVGVVVLIVLLVLPTVVAGLSHTDLTAASNQTATNASEVTFVTA